MLFSTAQLFLKLRAPLRRLIWHRSQVKSLRVLWLIDSVTSLVIALVFLLVATNPASASRGVVALVALIPTTTAILIYYFIGNFIGGHVHLAAALLSFAAALLKSPE